MFLQMHRSLQAERTPYFVITHTNKHVHKDTHTHTHTHTHIHTHKHIYTRSVQHTLLQFIQIILCIHKDTTHTHTHTHAHAHTHTHASGAYTILCCNTYK